MEEQRVFQAFFLSELRRIYPMREEVPVRTEEEAEEETEEETEEEEEKEKSGGDEDMEVEE
jgi:uncharacterized protein YbaR (Trm112 family)